jgi:hypothetical protein
MREVRAAFLSVAGAGVGLSQTDVALRASFSRMRGAQLSPRRETG